MAILSGWQSSRPELCARAVLTRAVYTPGLVNISNSIPDNFTVGTAEVSVPLVLSLKESISTIVKLAVAAATAMQVLLIIGCITSGLTAIGSRTCFLFSLLYYSLLLLGTQTQTDDIIQ